MEGMDPGPDSCFKKETNYLEDNAEKNIYISSLCCGSFIYYSVSPAADTSDHAVPDCIVSTGGTRRPESVPPPTPACGEAHRHELTELKCPFQTNVSFYGLFFVICYSNICTCCVILKI